jgi:MOSC domain-containing protein YiiM
VGPALPAAGGLVTEISAQHRLPTRPPVLGEVVEVRAGACREWDDGDAPDHGAGDPRTARRRTWTSGIAKDAVTSAVRVGPLGLEGDEQGDPRHHGGPTKAVFVHPIEHYDLWRSELGLLHDGREDFGPGAFGENLVVSGCDEATVCLGDVLRIGEVEVQVTQPRRPCWKPARRWGVKDLVLRIEETGRTGWYLRVRTPGRLRGGDRLELLERPRPDWPVSRVSAVMRHRRSDLAAAAELAGVEELPPSWAADLRKAIARGEVDESMRTRGPGS